MEELVSTTADYCIWRADASCLHELAEFVVRENEKHHDGSKDVVETAKDIERVYAEELEYFSDAYVYIVRARNGKIIGSIRVFRWNNRSRLPIEKIFGINPLDAASKVSEFWHVGRFAIDSYAGISTLKLFKQLMAMAIRPIVEAESSCMIAETDSKLLKVMNALGIGTVQLAPSLIHLYSETIPIYSLKEDLMPFFKNYGHLSIAS